MRNWILAAALFWACATQAAPPEWVSAEVVKVEPGRSRVTLDHARIKSIDMEAMIMPFKAEKSVDLSTFKPGDKARFRVAEKDGHLVVEAMEKVK